MIEITAPHRGFPSLQQQTSVLDLTDARVLECEQTAAGMREKRSRGRPIMPTSPTTKCGGRECPHTFGHTEELDFSLHTRREQNRESTLLTRRRSKSNGSEILYGWKKNTCWMILQNAPKEEMCRRIAASAVWRCSVFWHVVAPALEYTAALFLFLAARPVFVFALRHLLLVDLPHQVKEHLREGDRTQRRVSYSRETTMRLYGSNSAATPLPVSTRWLRPPNLSDSPPLRLYAPPTMPSDWLHFTKKSQSKLKKKNNLKPPSKFIKQMQQSQKPEV